MNGIILIGDPSGNPDEGMKKIGKELIESLKDIGSRDVYFSSFLEIVKTPEAFPGISVAHYIAGPTWRSFIKLRLIKLRLGNVKTIVSFIHPKWSIIASKLIRICAPDAVTVHSERWANYVEKRMNMIFNCPLVGFNPRKYCPPTSELKMALRKQLGFPIDRKVILHVGHLNQGRNLSVMVDIAKNKALLPVVIGSTTVAPEHDLVLTLRRAGVRVIQKYIADIERYYQAADCYVFPTCDPNRCVQVPLSVIEALASGLPVVSTPFEGLPYYLPKFKGLFYLKKCDEIVDVIATALKSSNRPDPSMLSSFTWDSIAKNMNEIYSMVVGA